VDLALALHVRELALPRAHLLAEARDQLRAQDVDTTVEHATPERDLVLLGLEPADHAAKVVVGQGREIRKWFHRPPFLVGDLE
jgi:hypothetical protein